MKHELHPFCAIFPPMSDDELLVLADDMRTRGYDRDQPITLMPNGLIIDGRNRENAAEIASVTATYTTYQGDDPLSFVRARNLHRRHLTTAQRAFIAAELANIKLGDNQFVKGASNEAPSVSQDQAIDIMGVSRASLQDAVAIVNNGSSDLRLMVDTKVISLRDAATVARRIPKETQETMTPAEIKGAGRQKSTKPTSTKPIKPKREKIDVPYRKMQWPTPEQLQRPDFAEDNAGNRAHIERYGRTPLRPIVVADLLKAESATGGLVSAVLAVANEHQLDAKQFFDQIDELLAWVPQKDKANGEEHDFARDGHKTLSLLRRTLPIALDRLTVLAAALVAYDNVEN